jgi:hypothetical protein
LTTLTVSDSGRAVVKSDGCSKQFRVDPAVMLRLRAVLKRTSLSALAADYPAPQGAADTVTETISAGGERVRIGDFSSIPVQAQGELRPLLGILGELIGRAC